MTTDKKNIEDIYPLSDNQTSFLLNHLNAPDDDSGKLLVHGRLAGELDNQRFINAWQAVVNRHSALRTTIHWKKTDKPLQAVRKSIDIDIQFNHCGQDASDEQLLSNAANLFGQTLALDSSPNHRIIVYHYSDKHHVMHWLCHHVFIDGWSTAVALNDLINIYNDYSGIDTEHLPDNEPPQFKDYLKWIQSQDLEQSRVFWLNRLSTTTSNTAESLNDDQATSKRFETEITITTACSSSLHEFCRLHNFTPGVIIQAAWVIVLSALSGARELSYTLTLSGRTAPLPFIEKLVGQLSTALPVFAKIEQKNSFIDLVHQIKQENNLLRNHEFLSPSQLSKWGYKPANAGFMHTESGIIAVDSLVVIENFVVAHKNTDNNRQGLRLINFQSDVVSPYSVTLMVLANNEDIQLRLISNHRRIDQEYNSSIANTLKDVLHAAINNPSISISDLLQLLDLVALETLQVTASQNIDKAPNYCAPETETQAHLQKIWQDILQTNHRISIHDNFFNIGGTSINALSIYARIETRFGCALPLASILEAPTIKQLADLIHDPVDSHAKHVVAIQQSGSKLPIFGIHAQDVLFYRDISAAIGDDQPFYAIQQLEQINGKQVQHQSLQHMATTYIQQIRQVQAHGPYTIIGLCMGATIGYEMAHQLTKSGEKINALILIDPDLPEMVFEKKQASLAKVLASSDLKTLNHIIANLFTKLANYPIARQLAIAKGQLRIARKSLSGPLEKRRAQRRLHNWRLNQKYKPSLYNGKITVIQSGEYCQSMNKLFNNSLNTEGENSSIDNYIIQGSHTNIFSPPIVYETVSIITKVIDN